MSRTSYRWTTQDIPDQTDRTFVVTGANSGLGFATTDALTAKGARVIMACRTESKARAAIEELSPAQRALTEFRRLDLADLDSVRAFTDGMAAQPVDVLINNAGVMLIPRSQTAQGHDMQFGTNVLGHFALTRGLLPTLTDRVVWLGSLMHKLGGDLDVDDLDWTRRKYDSAKNYGQSKLACIMLAYELQRRFQREGSTLRSMAAHPGYSATNLQGSSGRGMVDWFTALGNRMPGLSQSAAQGALPELYAATVADLPGGTYVGPDGGLEMRGFPRPVASVGQSHDPEVARRLWEECERLTAA